jgi:glucuronate isomerase
MYRIGAFLNFIHENFLLHSKAAERLYHDYAASEPILDFHSHLPASDIANDRDFADLFEIWLEGDHYKWRAMRANGVPERLCTGSALCHEKFLAWAHTVPFTLRNPLYHWAHLELKRYFDIDDLLDERTADSIWRRANTALQSEELSAQGILRKFNVRVVCTTDDPCDDLAYHRHVNAQDVGFRLYPTFRPDKALVVNRPEVFNEWLTRLEGASNVTISNLDHLLVALEQRHTFFHENGGRLSDHGLSHCFATPCTHVHAEKIFAKTRSGSAADPVEHEAFATFMMLYFGHLDSRRGWTKQLHLGPLRGANTRKLRELGADTGFDSIGDYPQATALSAYLDLLETEHSLPRMVIYNDNPADNYVFATAAGNFQDDSVPGKIQFGSGWWFLDQKEGIEAHLNALSNVGLLSRFVGMVTDSRSFMSFPRHEYFRRVLCNLLGKDMEEGDLPNDEPLIGEMVSRICFQNARDYLGLELPKASAPSNAKVARTV